MYYIIPVHVYSSTGVDSMLHSVLESSYLLEYYACTVHVDVYTLEYNRYCQYGIQVSICIPIMAILYQWTYRYLYI